MKFKVLLLVFIMLVFNFQVLAVDNEISIDNEVRVRGTDIKLVDIANIIGDTKFKERVEGISLGQAPLPSYQRTIYREQVLFALKDEEINLKEVDINIPYQFVVIADCKHLSFERLIAKVEDYIYEQIDYQTDQVEINVLSSDRDIVIPYGELKLKVENGRRRSLLGKIVLPIKVIINNRVYRRIYLQCEVKKHQKILVADKDIERGEMINKDLFKVQEEWTADSNNQYVSVNEELDGKRLKVSLKANQPLLKRMIELTPLVKRWKQVKIVAKIGGVVVTTTGKARQSGDKGEVIQVKNLNSGETVKGVVIGKNTVQVLID